MRRLLLSLALLLPLMAAGGFAYWTAREKAGGRTFQGMTVAEWEVNLASSPFSVYNAVLSVRTPKPSLWQRAGEWAGLLTPNKSAFTGGGYSLIDPEAIPVLTQLLESDDARVRRAAVQCLWLLGNEAKPAIPALTMALADSDEEVREAAERAIGWISPKPGQPRTSP